MSMRSDRERVVITGMGWITPLGHDLESVWRKLTTAGSGMAPITRFDAKTFPTTFAAEVQDFDFRDFVDDPAWHEHAGLNVQFALGAARQAWAQAGLASGAFDTLRAGIYLGAGEGVLDFENYAASNIAAWNTETRRIDGDRWVEEAKRRMDAWCEVEQEPNMPLAHLSREFGLQGPAYNFLTACAFQVTTPPHAGTPSHHLMTSLST